MPAMSQRGAAAVALVLVIATPAGAEPDTPPQRSLAYISEPGDPVGQGRSETALPRFTYARRDGIYIDAFDGQRFYTLSLLPPQGAELARGTYEDARGGTEARPDRPALDFATDRACDGSRGRFVITDIAYDGNGQVVRLNAEFEQRCTGATGTLWGDIALDAGLKSYAATLAKRGAYHPTEASAYMVVRCDGAPTWGELRVTATQRARDGSWVTGASDGTFGCGPQPSRVELDLLLGSDSRWRPGPVQVEVESYVNDPHYDEAGRVLRKSLQGTVYLQRRSR